MEKHLQIISRKIAKRIGMAHYFTGKPCCNGHISTRNTKYGQCYKCNGESYKKWYKSNKSRVYSCHKEWVSNNVERYRTLVNRGSSAHRSRNRDWYNLYMRSVNSSRRSKIYHGDSANTVTDWANRQEKYCFYCGEECKSNYHLDHFVPISRGGEHKIKNLVISCPSCNQKKGFMMPYHFIGKFYGWSIVS